MAPMSGVTTNFVLFFSLEIMSTEGTPFVGHKRLEVALAVVKSCHLTIEGTFTVIYFYNVCNEKKKTWKDVEGSNVGSG
jgi:hypothetical protein